MPLTDQIIQRYQFGGDIYATLAEQYGQGSAAFIARAAATGDRQQLTDAIARVRTGAPLPTSITAILLEQLVTDPLGAPLDAANKAVGTLVTNTAKSFFRNPWVVLVLFVAGASLWVHFLGVPKVFKR